MAKQSVTAESLPPFKPTREDTGIDTHNSAENARWALNGIEAIGSVILENISGETKGSWSDDFIWHLHQGQQVLAAFARREVEALDHELWFTHALLGDRGEDARLRAQRELIAVEEKKAA